MTIFGRPWWLVLLLALTGIGLIVFGLLCAIDYVYSEIEKAAEEQGYIDY